MPLTVEHPLIARVDRAGDEAMARLRGRPVPDVVMYTLSAWGDMSLIWHVAGVVGGLRRGGDVAYAARLSSVQGIEAALVNGPVKAIFRRKRPLEPTEARPHALRVPRTSSFPSGHASAAACAVVMLSEGAGPIERAGWVALGSAVALSRVHVGVHHTSDVVAGAVIGGALGALARRWWPLR